MSVVVVAEPSRLAHHSIWSQVRAKAWIVWAAILGVVLVVAVLGQRITPYDPHEQSPREKFLRPFTSSARGLHILGTDELGRDVLSQTMEGARLTMFIALTSAAIGALLGVALGLIAGYRGGWVDRVVMRLTEAQTAMPMFLIALLLLATLGASVWNLIAVLPTYVWPTFARLIRAETLRLKTAPFVEAAEALGCPTLRIMWRHLFPNLLGRVGVLAAISVGQVTLSESGLSFIGAGVQGDDITWGALIAGGRQYLRVAWWPSLLPGVFVGVTVFALNGLARRFSAQEGRG